MDNVSRLIYAPENNCLERMTKKCANSLKPEKDMERISVLIEGVKSDSGDVPLHFSYTAYFPRGMNHILAIYPRSGRVVQNYNSRNEELPQHLREGMMDGSMPYLYVWLGNTIRSPIKHYWFLRENPFEKSLPYLLSHRQKGFPLPNTLPKEAKSRHLPIINEQYTALMQFYADQISAMDTPSPQVLQKVYGILKIPRI